MKGTFTIKRKYLFRIIFLIFIQTINILFIVSTSIWNDNLIKL